MSAASATKSHNGKTHEPTCEQVATALKLIELCAGRSAAPMPKELSDAATAILITHLGGTPPAPAPAPET